VIANFGKIPVWNLLTGDTVIVDGLVATVNADPERDGGAVTVEFLVNEILPNDETTPTGEWLATPRVFSVTFDNDDTQIPFLITKHVEVAK
jgi:hypothetical protein